MIAILINEFLKVTVKSSGAEMVSLKNTISNKEYLWQGNPTFWGRRAPVLFPIVGKVKGNQYKVDGKVYDLPQHGFARDMHFELIDQEENSLVYVLKSNEETLKIYPFNFELYIRYRLEENKLIVGYEVKNTDDNTIWFSLGAHPAFNCPLEKTESFEDYYLEFEKEETLSTMLLNTDGLLSGETQIVSYNEKTLPLTKSLFDNDALIFKDMRSREITLRSHKSKHSIKMDFTGFPYLGVWTKKGGAPFVCLEPWYGVADSSSFAGDYKDKEAIRSLAKGKSFAAEYSLEIK